jgi:hypothetical protein
VKLHARAILLIAAAALVRPAVGNAQTLRGECSPEGLCEVTDAAVTLSPRLALAAAGGNPVAGTASTHGMRVPGSPRWSVALRGTFVPVDLPPAAGIQQSPVIWSAAADASLGIFNGVQLLPTIGGFGSIDALGSIGLLNVPQGDGFDTGTPLTWALGVRVGVLRESFTAPGVSLSAMYRSLPDVAYAEGVNASFENTGQSVMTYRATVGKRLLGLGLTAGLAHDRGSSEVSARYVDTTPVQLESSIGPRDVSFDRTAFFANVSYTLLILNMAAELGWQESGDRPAGAHANTGKGGLFGGIAVRLAI